MTDQAPELLPWQLIETARHKNGTRILAWDGKQQFTCFYRGEHHLPHQDKPGWFDQHIRMHPTHWKPLGAGPNTHPTPAERPVTQVREDDLTAVIEPALKEYPNARHIACKVLGYLRALTARPSDAAVAWRTPKGDGKGHFFIENIATIKEDERKHFSPLYALPPDEPARVTPSTVGGEVLDGAMQKAVALVQNQLDRIKYVASILHQDVEGHVDTIQRIADENMSPTIASEKE